MIRSQCFFAILSCILCYLGLPNAVGEEVAAATGALVRLSPPVSVKSHPLQGEGKKRRAGLEVTNNSDKSIAEIVCRISFVNKEGRIGKSVPHTESWIFGNPKGELATGGSKLITVENFFMEDDTASVDGIVTSIIWKDGTKWPDWRGGTPKPEGDAPVVARFLGIVGEGDMAQPAVGVYNVGTKDIAGIGYAMGYRDADGKTLGWDNYGYFGDEKWLPVGKTSGCTGGTGPPPEGAVSVKISLNLVKFADESVWQPTIRAAAAEVLEKIDPKAVAEARTKSGGKKNPATGSPDPEVVAMAFITALANKDVHEAAEYIIPAERDEINKEMEKGMPPLPKDPQIRIKIKDNGIQADVSLLNARKPASGPPFGFDMELSEGKWWIVK